MSTFSLKSDVAAVLVRIAQTGESLEKSLSCRIAGTRLPTQMLHWLTNNRLSDGLIPVFCG